MKPGRVQWKEMRKNKFGWSEQQQKPKEEERKEESLINPTTGSLGLKPLTFNKEKKEG